MAARIAWNAVADPAEVAINDEAVEGLNGDNVERNSDLSRWHFGNTSDVEARSDFGGSQWSESSGCLCEAPDAERHRFVRPHLPCLLLHETGPSLPPPLLDGKKPEEIVGALFGEMGRLAFTFSAGDMGVKTHLDAAATATSQTPSTESDSVPHQLQEALSSPDGKKMPSKANRTNVTQDSRDMTATLAAVQPVKISL